MTALPLAKRRKSSRKQERQGQAPDGIESGKVGREEKLQGNPWPGYGSRQRASTWRNATSAPGSASLPDGDGASKIVIDV